MNAETERMNDTASQQPGTHPERDIPPPWRGIVLLALVVAALLAIVYLSPLREYLGKARELSENIRSLGLFGPAALVVGVAVLVALGFPRLAFCVIAGMAFGFWKGLLWTQLGTLAGNYVLFLVARRGGGAWVRAFVAKRRKLSDLIHREGLTGVILARQLPLPGLLVNLAFGLVAIRHRDFLIGTLIGQLPEAIPCTLIGAGALKASFGKSAAFLGLAVALALAVWIVLRWFLSRQADSMQPGP
jgi:uncharacterized membrane protein YdjX (TVP38/TMEM64 family)